MSFFDSMKDELFNKVFTENGDVALASTGSYCLDYFSSIGGLRGQYTNLMNVFAKAYNEDPLMAIKILFYSRDILAGLGERTSFRFCFNFLCNFYPEVAKQLLEYVSKYGRYDDLLMALETPCEEECFKIISKQLKEDISNKENGKQISLLAKWLPSINTSNSEAREMARKIAQGLQMNYSSYRKTLSFLRKGIIIENYLREKDYTFAYDKQPSQAMFRYSEAFKRNDSERYSQYLDDVKEGRKTLTTKTLFPYQIIQRILDRSFNMDDEEKKALNITWEALDRQEIASKTIVVSDGSGSMYSWGEPHPICVAISLSILFAEQLAEPFKNKFITFSSHPQLVELKTRDIVSKTHEVRGHCEVANTNISRVYDLILNTAVNQHVKEEDMLERIVIISDMEFDSCTDDHNLDSTFTVCKNKFAKAGYKLPEIVFWNVSSHTIHFPVSKDEQNVKLVSGFSKNIINSIVSNTLLTPYEYMKIALAAYSEFDKIEIK